MSCSTAGCSGVVLQQELAPGSLSQSLAEDAAAAAGCELGCAAPCGYIFVETRVCSGFCRAAITKVSEPYCCLWSAHHCCAPLGQEDVVHLGQGVKEAQRFSNLVLMVIFVSASVNTSLRVGSKPPVCIVWPPSAVTDLVQWHRVGSSWMGPWMLISPVSEQNSRMCLAGVDVGWWGKKGMCSPEKQGVG